MPLSTLLVVRARRALARPLMRRSLVAALALATGLTVLSLVRAAEAARQSWGAGRPVAVATRALAPGDHLVTSAVEVRELPTAAVPAEALRQPPDGAVVRQPIVAGEAIVPERLAPAGVTGAAALVPEGWRAVAVPLAPVGAPPLAVGDRVDLLAVAPPGSLGDSGVAASAGSGGRLASAGGNAAADRDRPAGGDPGRDPGGNAGGDARDADRVPDADHDPAFPLVEGALVVDVAEDAASVAVPEADGPRVAFALTQGTIVLALSGQ